MTVIVIAGTARVRSEERARAVEAARVMAAASRAEDGCRQYRFSADLDDPNVVHVFEEWDSAEALDLHFATPHMAEFQTALGAVLDGSPEITRFEVAAAGPLFA